MATVDIYLDMHNSSKNPSPEIEAMYLYTDDGWRFSDSRIKSAPTQRPSGSIIIAFAILFALLYAVSCKVVGRKSR